jgi:hypothetical protein
MNMLLKIKSILGGARERFFCKARCTLLVLPVGAVAVGLAARCLTEKRYKLCV